jgi:hypothetical protein
MRCPGIWSSWCVFPSHGPHSLAFTTFSLHCVCLPTNRKRGKNTYLVLLRTCPPSIRPGSSSSFRAWSGSWVWFLRAGW